MQPGTDALGAALIALARNAIAADLGLAERPQPQHAALGAAGATFVTLRKGEALRGCIGSLQAHRPLREDVRANARAAAFRDPRFAPLQRAEFERISVEVSLIGAAVPVEAATEDDALSQLVPGEDGVVLRRQALHATFLPQVWDQLGDRREFLRELRRKAGLAPDFWDAEIRLERYRVVRYPERAGPA
jgi:AmmeMemoRadiSam system protein A